MTPRHALYLLSRVSLPVSREYFFIFFWRWEINRATRSFVLHDLREIILKNIYFFEECERIRRVRIVYIRKEKGRGEVSRVLLRKASGSDLESSFRLSIKRRFSSWQLAKFGTLYSSLGANDWDLIRGKMTLSTLPTVITISWSGNGVLSTNISFRFDSSFLSIVKCQVLCIVDEGTNFQNFVNEKRETNGYRNEILFYSKVSSRYIYILKIENEEKKKKKKNPLLDISWNDIFHSRYRNWKLKLPTKENATYSPVPG